MVRAPADWRSVLRRAEILVRRHDIRSLELLLPALHWRDVTARNRAVVLLARLGPMAVPALFARLDDAATAAPPARLCFEICRKRRGMRASRPRRRPARAPPAGPWSRSRTRPGILGNPWRGPRRRHSGHCERDTRRKS